MALTDSPTALPTVTPSRPRRLAVVVAGAAAALLVWVVGRLAAGEILAPSFDGTAAQTIAPIQMMVSAALAGLAGWGLLALLERVAANGRSIWLAVAVVVTVLSLGAPFSGEGVELGDRLVLAAAHLAVAAVVIVGLMRGTPGSKG